MFIVEDVLITTNIPLLGIFPTLHNNACIVSETDHDDLAIESQTPKKELF